MTLCHITARRRCAGLRSRTSRHASGHTLRHMPYHTGVCNISARHLYRIINVSFAPVPPKFKVEKKAPKPIHLIGRLFCAPIHSTFYFVNIDLWGKGG